MLISKLFTSVSILIAVVFVTITLMVFPVWPYIHAFLGTDLPVAPVLVLIGIIYAVYGVRLLAISRKADRLDWKHFVVLALVNVVMLVLMAILLKELGAERNIIIRNLGVYLPPAAWVAAVILFLWQAPHWKPLLNDNLRLALIGGMAVIPILWASLPWQVQITAPPVLFRHQDGLTAIWETNMLSASWVEYGTQPEMANKAVSQSGGLLDVSDRLQRVFIPVSPDTTDLYLKANSEGIRTIKLSHVVKSGKAESETELFSLPDTEDELFIVAFSDIHDQLGTYTRLAANIPWAEVDEAFYIGDLMSYAVDPHQVASSILGLPTGGYNIPRVFVRGNHETRGEGAYELDQWLLPPGGKWYYTFSSGNVFFIVLDSGEDKVDSHPEYSGMVNFAGYHLEQAEWLKTVFASPEYKNAQYQVILVHIPPFTNENSGELSFIAPGFAPVQSLLKSQFDIDLLMSGHIHNGEIWLPEETGYPFPITTCGGSEENDMAAVAARFRSDGIELSVLDIEANLVENAFIPKQ